MITGNKSSPPNQKVGKRSFTIQDCLEKFVEREQLAPEVGSKVVELTEQGGLDCTVVNDTEFFSCLLFSLLFDYTFCRHYCSS